MSAFHRFIFSTFLFLALCCFGVSSAFATTFTYYQSGDKLQCSESKESICAYNFGKNFPQTVFTPNSYTVTEYKFLQCARVPNINGYPSDYESKTTITYTDGITSPKITYSGGQTGAARPLSAVCEFPNKLELDGCTPKCVVDPCAELKDQETTALVQCGTASCPSPATFEYSGGTVGCTGGAKTLLVPTPAATAVVDSCSATLKPSSALPTGAKVKTTASGSSTQAYCYASYIYTGTSASPDVTPDDLVSLSFGGVTPTTEDGQCPDGTVKGQLNNQWVCVADSNAGEGSGCPTGQIKNNSGECVPFAEAGTGTGTGTGTGDGSGTGTGDGSGGSGSDGGDGSGTGSGGGGSGTGSGGGGSGTCDPQTGTGCAPEGTENAGAEGTYSGSVGCENAPDCTGDVVQCGLIHQQWQSGCDLQKNLTGIPEGGGSQYAEVGTNTNDSRVTAAVGSLTSYTNDIKSFLVPPSSGSCPADFSLSVFNRSVAIPLSKVCPLFQFMRFLLHLIVNLLCLRILYSSFVRV